MVVRTTSDSSSRSSGNLRHSQTKAEKSTTEDFLGIPSYYKRFNTRKGKILPCAGCKQLPFRVTLFVVTR